MIKTISIKDIATFDKTGTELKELKKINFIYRANGTGKTTLSNFIIDPKDNENCEIEWEGTQQLKTLVYKKKDP